MKDNAADKIRNAIEDLIRDKKTLVKILSIAAILLLAVILRIHGANKADITVETADAAATEVSDTSGSDDGPSSSDRLIYVDLGGAVAKPGVYKVTPDTRLYMVIEMAGGLTEDADTNSVNQASFVEDGEKILIPLDPELNAMENAGKYFDKYSKLKRTKEALESLTLEVKNEIDHLESILTSLDIAEKEEDLNEIRQELIQT